MKTCTGTLLKMETEFSEPIIYKLKLGNEKVIMNQLIGSEISIKYQGEIYCLSCGKKTPKSFAQGFCYKCFLSSPETSECILRPELCEAHLGISRDMEWSKEHCLSDHYVYLALSSGLKVGVTREGQIPTRWIDQGAWKAIKLAMTPNRYLAGTIEVELKKHMSDKTSWQKMLQNQLASDIDLVEEKQKAWELLDPDLQQYVIDDDEVLEINYPVNKYPEKVKSLNLDKTPEISGTLTGIKGQYLIFNDEQVINIRTYSGYKISLEF